MAVLVTRPEPDNENTAAALRAKGLEVLLSPVLRFEPVAFEIDPDAGYDAVIVTSANALRALAAHPRKESLLRLAVFAVGRHTAEAARDAGFHNVAAAGGDAIALRDLIMDSVRAKTLPKAARIFYLAAADRSCDLAGELGARGLAVETAICYRMAPVANLAREVCDAFAANRISAVLHYSRRSARAFLDAVRVGGVEISALAIPQCCISAAVASILRDAGAPYVVVASAPAENAVLEALDGALQPLSR
ncbi:uroporphyrinogen-III synthase [Nitrobacter sp.]|uniref:uroporphyrinogen-III synthase n=1 Tax=Nitrobacter sp. TaxID=29420 RepID=UPI0029CAB37C|nr:uroporphyrinogen-III synthase [Nitrobacter sp.]